MIESIMLVDMGHKNLQAYVVFENRETYLFDLTTLKVTHHFQFESEYDAPKKQKKKKMWTNLNSIIKKCDQNTLKKAVEGISSKGHLKSKQRVSAQESYTNINNTPPLS